MDPVTATGLVAAIIQLIGTTATAISYVNDIKEAPTERARFAREASGLLQLLTDLRYRAEEARTEADPWFSSLRHLSGADGPLAQLEQHLERLNHKLRPVSGSSTSIRVRKLAKNMLWTLDKKDMEQTLSQIERVKTLVSLALQNDHFELSLSIKEDIQEVRHDLRTVTRTIAEGHQKEADGERVKVLSWLSVLNSTSKQQTGVGKSSLASLVINFLENHHRDSDAVVAYLFCNYKEEEIQTSRNLLCELLHHILQRKRSIPEDVHELYKTHSAGAKRPNVDDVVPILVREVENCSTAFIVVDAVDECPERENIRCDFLSTLQDLPSNKVRILCTSRHIPDVERGLDSCARLEINSTEDDIRHYLAGRIDTESSQRRRRVLTTPGLREEIIQTVATRAQGMFLLAQLHVESLARKLTCRDVRASLASLPKGIDDAYNQAMERIKTQYEEESQLAISVLSWIIFTFRPLTVSELQHALAVQPGDRDLDRDGIPDEESILSVCAGLVTVEQESRTVRLVHYTAQQYFEREDIRQHHFEHSRKLIAEACLTHLLFRTFSEQVASGYREADCWRWEYPFHAYARAQWGNHARTRMNEKVKSLVWSFLNNPACLMNCYCDWTIPKTRKYRKAWELTAEELTKLFRPCPMEVAATVGLVDATRQLLEKELPQPGSPILCRALVCAINENHVDVVRLLIDWGALC